MYIRWLTSHSVGNIIHSASLITSKVAKNELAEELIMRILSVIDGCWNSASDARI